MEKIIKLIFLSLIIGIAGFLYSFNYQSFGGDNILGNYWTPEKDGKIKFFKKNDKYYGKLYWTKSDPNKLDTKNPVEKYRKRKILGINIFFSFKYDKDDKIWKGKVYDPKEGKIYKCNVWLKNAGTTLMVRGYIGISLLGRTESFERIDE